MWINKLFQTCYVIFLSILIMKLKKETHIRSIVFFHSPDSSFCNFSIKLLHSSGPRSEITLSSFVILWLYMIHSKRYILIKLTYSSKIIFFVNNLQKLAFFAFLDVLSIFLLLDLLSVISLSIWNLWAYHSLIYL